MRSLILAGGEFPPLSWLSSVYCPGDLVIAADRGGMLAHQANLPLDILVGDFDSLPSSFDRSAFPSAEVRSFPCDKDYSDTEIALRVAAEKGCQEALIVGALGGRYDHSLFNTIAVLELADQLGMRAALRTPDTYVRQLTSTQELALNDFNGWHCSLIALDEEVAISMQGLLYNGSSLVLKRASTRGLSNEVIGPTPLVTAKRGRILLVLTNPAL